MLNLLVRLNNSVFFILHIIGLICIFFIGLSLFNQLACEGQLVYHYSSPSILQKVWKEQFLSQSFIAPRNDLNRIDVLLRTDERKNNQLMTFQLLDISENLDDPLQSSVEVFSDTFTINSILTQQWHTFTFEPIADSSQKKYIFSFQAPESELDSATAIIGIDEDLYDRGTFFIGTTPVQADMTFRACFDMSISEKFQVLAKQLTNQRPSLWSSQIFYWGVFGVYGVLLVYFFWKLSQYLSKHSIL